MFILCVYVNMLVICDKITLPSCSYVKVKRVEEKQLTYCHYYTNILKFKGY